MSNHDLRGPSGSRSGRGGYLEYNDENFKKFANYFRRLLPSGMTPEHLTVLSTTFHKKYPNYKVLPPTDLWPNMLPTLTLLREIRRLTSVEFSIESGYRSLDVNQKSEGVSKSAHLDF